MEEDDELFIGPPPPALVAEAESANEAERFEEVPKFTPYLSYSDLAMSLIGGIYQLQPCVFHFECGIFLSCGPSGTSYRFIPCGSCPILLIFPC